MEELFRDVKGYKGAYKVSNLGRVLSLKREVPNRNGYRIVKERILKQSINKKGYKIVGLSTNGKSTLKLVHTLVAESFLNHTTDNHPRIVVDHIDNTTVNNRLDNLQLISNRENVSKLQRGSSKYTGVCWCKHNNKWVASICIEYKHYTLGYYTDEKEASLAYQKRLKQLLK